MVDLMNKVTLLNTLVAFNIQFYQFKRFLFLQQKTYTFNVLTHVSLAVRLGFRTCFVVGLID